MAEQSPNSKLLNEPESKEAEVKKAEDDKAEDDKAEDDRAKDDKAGSGSLAGDWEMRMQNVLQRVQAFSGPHSKEIDDIIEILLPDMLSDLKEYNAIYEEVRKIDATMKSNLSNAAAIDQDIGNIYLDLHEKYRKWERIDSVKMESSMREILKKKARESEKLQERNRHYVSCDPSPEVVENAEKSTFSTNMLAVKKSEFSIQLNRRNKYFHEVEKVLNMKSEKLEKKDEEWKCKQDGTEN